jgi:hypothetical protein
MDFKIEVMDGPAAFVLLAEVFGLEDDVAHLSHIGWIRYQARCDRKNVEDI